jgi:LPXTG-motif cell wall-anchored protein
VAQGDIQFTGGDNTDGVDITGLPEGVTIVGVVVKGGPAYNVYPNLGALPRKGLHAPLVKSGKPAAVSHWFACGTGKTETSTPPTDTSTVTPTTTPSEGEGSGGGGATATSASEDVSPAAQEEELAETGVETGPLLALGVAMLLGGGALVLVMRGRGARR